MRSNPRRSSSIHAHFKLLFTLLGGIALSACCCGARTGLEVPPPTVVTFERSERGRVEIFQAPPGGGMPEGSIRLGGVNVLGHSVHGGGDLMAYSTAVGLWVRDWRGHDTNRHAQNGISGIDWTGDTRWIAFIHDYRLWKIEAAGTGGPTPLTDAPGTRPDALFAATPSWTPDGNELFFIRYRTGLNSGGDPVVMGRALWRVNADGGNLRQETAAVPAPGHVGVAVSRDGTAVLYAIGPEAAPSIVRLDLANRTTSVLVANGRDPAFSASGRNLAFIRNGQVWACRYEGTTCTGEHQVSNGTNDRTPSWVGG